MSENLQSWQFHSPSFALCFTAWPCALGRAFPLEHPGPSASHPHLCSSERNLFPPLWLQLALHWWEPAEPVFQRQLCCRSFLSSLDPSTGCRCSACPCQHRGCPAVGSEHRRLCLGVVGLWSLHQELCSRACCCTGAAAVPGQAVLLCRAQLGLQHSLVCPPRS